MLVWLLTAALSASVLMAVHVVAMALASWAVGATLREVRIFYGPSVLLRARPVVRLGVVPMGGYVTYAVSFEALAVWRRALVLLAGNVALLVIACVLLGPEHALGSFARTVPQLGGLFVDSRHAGHAIRGFFALTDPRTIAGLLAAKLAVFNLLPLENLNGGGLVRLALPVDRHPRFDRAYRLVSSLAILSLFAALVAAWLRS